jgi:hypothetical protein
MVSRVIAIVWLIASLSYLMGSAAGAAEPAIEPYKVKIVVQVETVLAPDELFVYCCGEREPLPRDGSAWEIRTADETRRIAVVPLGDPHFATEWPLSAANLSRIGPLPDGNYVIAWTIDHRRVSNVASFRIDSQFNPTKSPLLALSQMEPPSDREFPYLILRAFRPQKSDPAPLNEEIMYPLLSFDGQIRDVDGKYINGMDEPLAIGTGYAYPLDVPSYTWLPEQSKSINPPQLGKPYTVFALVGKGHRKSNSIAISYKHPLADAWDAATASIKPAELPPVMLRGTVIGPDGKPVATYWVAVQKETDSGRVFGELTDAAGEFEFRTLPAGTYDISAKDALGEGAKLIVRNVIVNAHGVADLKLDFRQSFHISGRVPRADNTPAVGRKVSGEWTSPDGAERYDASAITDAAGQYTIGSPFKTALYDFVVDGHLAPGKTDAAQEVDFVLGDRESP